MDSSKPRIVILISGSGSNLQAFIDAASSNQLNAEIACVVSNKRDAFGLTRAQNAGIATEVIDHTTFDSRESFDQALAKTIHTYKPDLIILAGFMRILTTEFVDQFTGKMLNVHPSLLPKYTGLNTHQRAIDAGDEHAGVTVHFVTAELDGGPPVLQAKVSIETKDTAEDLAKRVLNQEHKIYPLAAQWFLENRLKLKEDGAYLDDKKLPEQGHPFN
jgi:phosphoribosylglycinamide formyltransferase-1